MNNRRTLVLGAMVLFTAVTRLLPHLPNFTPVIALALFSGASFDRKSSALWIPLAAMAASDLLLTLTGTGFIPSIQLVVYATLLLMTAIGFALRGRVRPLTVGLSSIGGSVVFYIVTNFAVWVEGWNYPRTLAGLAECYIAAIPFFGNMVLATLLYSAALFLIMSTVERRFPVLAEQRA